jgi:hypothetical protein
MAGLMRVCVEANGRKVGTGIEAGGTGVWACVVVAVNPRVRPSRTWRKTDVLSIQTTNYLRRIVITPDPKTNRSI